MGIGVWEKCCDLCLGMCSYNTCFEKSKQKLHKVVQMFYLQYVKTCQWIKSYCTKIIKKLLLFQILVVRGLVVFFIQKYF